jgi:hypothetical protein
MTTQPNEITLCQLEVVLMPNGEVICLGNRVGMFKDLKKYLVPADKKKGAVKS